MPAMSCPKPVRAAALLAALLALGAGPGAAQDGAAVAPVASYLVTTDQRTLRGCPTKHVIVDRAGWRRVTAGLEGAPPAPDFSERAVVLVVADASGGATSRVTELARRDDGSLRVRLDREEPPDGPAAGADLVLECFFLVVPTFPGGLYLEHRTSLGEGLGYVQRPIPPSEADRLPAALPQLGPDVRLSYGMLDGSAPPAEGVVLRLETTFPDRPDIPARTRSGGLPGDGLGMRFPRIRDGARHLLAAHTDGLRSANALVLRGLPAPDGSGSPAPVVHRFLLEPVPDRR